MQHDRGGGLAGQDSLLGLSRDPLDHVGFVALRYRQARQEDVLQQQRSRPVGHGAEVRSHVRARAAEPVALRADGAEDLLAMGRVGGAVQGRLVALQHLLACASLLLEQRMRLRAHRGVLVHEQIPLVPEVERPRRNAAVLERAQEQARPVGVVHHGLGRLVPDRRGEAPPPPEQERQCFQVGMGLEVRMDRHAGLRPRAPARPGTGTPRRPRRTRRSRSRRSACHA